VKTPTSAELTQLTHTIAPVEGLCIELDNLVIAAAWRLAGLNGEM
jgi:hypothetical protein